MAGTSTECLYVAGTSTKCPSVAGTSTECPLRRGVCVWLGPRPLLCEHMHIHMQY